MNNPYLFSLFFILTLTVGLPPVYEAWGLTVIGITESGAEIDIDIPPATQQSLANNNATNILFALTSKFVDQENSGILIHGSGTVGEQQSMKPYTTVPTNTDFAALVLDEEVRESMVISNFWKQFSYSGGVLTDVTPIVPNILNNDRSKNMQGSTSVSQNDDGITITGTGTRVIKVSSSSPDVLLRGTLNNADVKVVTSPLDLTTLVMSGVRWIVEQVTNPSQQITSSISEYHRIPRRGGGGGYTHHIHQTWNMVSYYGNLIVAAGADLIGTFQSSHSIQHYTHGWCYRSGCRQVHYHQLGTSGTSVLSIQDVTNGQRITQQTTSGNMYNAAGSKLHTIYSVHPWNEQLHHTASFEEQYSFGSIDTYLVVELGAGGSATIKAEPLGAGGNNFIEIDGLTGNIPYQISKDGLVIISGMADASGFTDVANISNIAGTVGGDLVLYPESLNHRGSFDKLVFDSFNHDLFEAPRSEPSNDLIYVAQKYIKSGTSDATISNVGFDDTEYMPYMSGNYTAGQNMFSPVVPGFKSVTFDIDGSPTTIKYEDVLGSTGIKVANPSTNTIPVKQLDSAIHSITAQTGVSESFLVTHDGDFTIKVDITSSGDASIINSYYIEQIPPPPPRPISRDPLSTYVEIRINEELYGERKELAVHDDPAFSESASGGTTVRRSVSYHYPDYYSAGTLTFPANVGDFVEVYLYAEITGEIGGYSPPSGFRLLGSSGDAVATVNIREASIIIP